MLGLAGGGGYAAALGQYGGGEAAAQAARAAGDKPNVVHAFVGLKFMTKVRQAGEGYFVEKLKFGLLKSSGWTVGNGAGSGWQMKNAASKVRLVFNSG
ncbi:hypothetical protein GCM10027345_17490 [Hymenobacter daeguensis]